MQSNEIANWMQVAASIAVLAGLGLVIFELRQARELATAEVLGQQFAMAVQFDSAMFGEDLATSLAKACTGESPITARDAIILGKL
jgi:hypothetical protein